MLLRKFKWLMPIVGVAALLAPTGSAADKEPTRKAAPASKLDLTPENAPELFALVRPQPTEWRHLQVQWMTDVVAARRQAAKDDKPIVVLYTGGAGYNVNFTTKPGLYTVEVEDGESLVTHVIGDVAATAP